jgi:hypothetical protein
MYELVLVCVKLRSSTTCGHARAGSCRGEGIKRRWQVWISWRPILTELAQRGDSRITGERVRARARDQQSAWCGCCVARRSYISYVSLCVSLFQTFEMKK